MASSTFSGPLKAGTIRENAGINVGFCVMAQSEAIIQTVTPLATSIIIPAGSLIIDITFHVTVAWDGTTPRVTVGTDVTPVELATGIDLETINTVVSARAGTEIATAWDVGTSDVTIWHDANATGTAVGRAFLTVQYIQNIGLAPIA